MPYRVENIVRKGEITRNKQFLLFSLFFPELYIYLVRQNAALYGNELMDSLHVYQRSQFVLIVWCLTPFSTVFKLHRGGQCTYPYFYGVLLTSTPHNILSKFLVVFPHNHCRNNAQRWERNESCRNDYHQSSERTLAEPGIEPATSCSQVRNSTNWAMGLRVGLNSLGADCVKGTGFGERWEL